MKLNKFIDHTLLKPEALQKDFDKLCHEAIEFDFATVCVQPMWIKYCKDILKSSSVKVCTVVGFPLGLNFTDVKLLETQHSLDLGAGEIDMVLNISDLKNGQYSKVQEDIAKLKNLCAKYNAPLKVIFETCLLTKEEIVKACELSVAAKADFVKTSTGFSKSGATIEDVVLMKASVNGNAQVKASGGVRDADTAKKMIEAGATRLGTSSGVEIMKGLTSSASY